MHKSHQTRMTEYTQQLNEKHANQVKSLHEDYESQLSILRESLDASTKNPEEEDSSKQELLAKIEELMQSASDSTLLHENELSELKAQSEAQSSELEIRHQEQLEKVADELKVIQT